MSDTKFILVLLWTAALALAVHYGVPGAVWVMVAMCGVWLLADGVDEYLHGLERRPGNVPPAPVPRYPPGADVLRWPEDGYRGHAPLAAAPTWTQGAPDRKYNRDAKGRFARKEAKA